MVRDRGAMARQVGQGQIENVYGLQIMNATEHDQQYVLKVEGMAERIVSDAQVVVDAAGARWVPVRVQVPPDAVAAALIPLPL